MSKMFSLKGDYEENTLGGSSLPRGASANDIPNTTADPRPSVNNQTPVGNTGKKSERK